MALLHITDASGRRWKFALGAADVCTIGRAPDNSVVLNDPRASRHHAHVRFRDGAYFIFDGSVDGKPSANHVFVGGEQRREHQLREGDRITIGASQLDFDLSDERRPEPETRFEDRPLGHTQLLASAQDVIRVLSQRPAMVAPSAELEELRRKAKILALLYDMTKTLGSVFDLDRIFDKACEVIFSATPADRVVALLGDEREQGLGREGEQPDGGEGARRAVIGLAAEERDHTDVAGRAAAGEGDLGAVERPGALELPLGEDVERAGLVALVEERLPGL